MTKTERDKIVHLMKCGALHGVDTGRIDGKCEDVIPLEDAIVIVDLVYKGEIGKLLKLAESEEQNKEIDDHSEAITEITFFLNDIELEPNTKLGQAMKMAIKALGQELILDKIRDEILEYIDDLDVAAEICDIFDKYTDNYRNGYSRKE